MVAVFQWISGLDDYDPVRAIADPVPPFSRSTRGRRGRDPEYERLGGRSCGLRRHDRQHRYSIKPPSVAGGTIKVKDTLKFTFNIFSQ